MPASRLPYSLEKESLLGNDHLSPPRRSWRRPLLLLPVALIAAVALHSLSPGRQQSGYAGDACVQFPPLVPAVNTGLDANHDFIFGAEYQAPSAEMLSGLVQIPSESYDDNGPVGEDERWAVFFKLEAYLGRTFPLLDEKLEKTKVNTHGLFYTWSGSDSSLKPALLMAHQDVVPVNPDTVLEWTHPPYSGFFDGKALWGRGSVDCKDTLSGILEAVTLLLEQGFTPRRTILFSFGFDEESKGTDGAGELAKHIESIYGKDSIAFIVDEGGLGVGEKFGKGFAMPATGEKGYLDVTISLHTPGGHSSIPPPHTGIGILAQVITSLESTPFSPSLSLESPIYSLLQCAAEHGDISSDLRKGVQRASQSGKKGVAGRQALADKYATLGRDERFLVTTSQAVDVIQGGVKVNALPETSLVVVNYRVSVDSNLDFVKGQITRQLLPIAKRHALDVEAFGETQVDHSTNKSPDLPGGLLRAVGTAPLSAAPISSTSSSAWKLLSSTIRHAFSSSFPDGILVSPCLMGGNTDTQFYWSLTPNIFRFSPSNPDTEEWIHTVDEHVMISDHLKAVWFYHELLRNADAADLES